MEGNLQIVTCSKSRFPNHKASLMDIKKLPQQHKIARAFIF
jgi:hypothetical protein